MIWDDNTYYIVYIICGEIAYVCQMVRFIFVPIKRQLPVKLNTFFIFSLIFVKVFLAIIRLDVLGLGMSYNTIQIWTNAMLNDNFAYLSRAYDYFMG